METPPIKRFTFENTYARLPERFFARVNPTPVTSASIVSVNLALAEVLELDTEMLASKYGAQVLAGNTIAQGSEPIAMAYAGHQFGGFVPQLGDGRAILLGEVVDPQGRRWDIQLKGAGPTLFSRNGDGRAALGPVLREYIMCEAFHALGIPATRALAVVTTGEEVWRGQRLPGAVLTRLASSHVRVGTFQYFAARQDVDGVRKLADYIINRHYAFVRDAPQRYLGLLKEIIARQAQLVARWMSIGFIHGVMNTDNMSVVGETIDFGPCAFMDAYQPAKVFSSIDHGGRYAYANQPLAAHWNLARLAEALLPLISEDTEAAKAAANEAVAGFGGAFESAYIEAFRFKLGLGQARENDAALIADLLDLMAATEADFTLTFRGLNAIASGGERNPDHISDALMLAPGFASWSQRWQQRLNLESSSREERLAVMRRANPLYIARNHTVEEAISVAIHSGDFHPFHRLVRVLSQPLDEQPDSHHYAEAPRSDQIVTQTFCGT